LSICRYEIPKPPRKEPLKIPSSDCGYFPKLVYAFKLTQLIETMIMLVLVVYLSLVLNSIAFVGVRIHSNRLVSPPLHMNIADRFFRVVKSNVNNVLSNLEDPEKMLDQAVSDMQKDLVKIRQSYAEITATQKRAQVAKGQAEKLSADWYKRAQLALEAGDEELAKEALSRRQIQLESVETLTKQILTQEGAITKLYDSMMELDSKIGDAKRQKDEFVARARTAKASAQVNDMLSTMSGSTSMDVFEKMKDKVETMEAEAEVAGELAAASSGSTSASMEDRFKALESGSSVDDELEMLKKQLPSSASASEESGGSLDALVAPKELPSQSSTELDAEYERLKRELGK
jgi:phage shock protein A